MLTFLTAMARCRARLGLTRKSSFLTAVDDSSSQASRRSRRGRGQQARPQARVSKDVFGEEGEE